MGPLAGVKIIELAGIGPAPFCAMLLADMGAEVVRVDRAANVGTDTDRDGNDARFNLLLRGRRNIAVDLKTKAGSGRGAAPDRPGRRADRGVPAGGHGAARPRPDICLKRNPKLVYGRMTGWGQDGPIAHIAGPRHQLHRAVRRAGGDRRGRTGRRCRRSIWSAISAAARSIWRWACWPASSAPAPPARDRSSTARWSRARPR